MEAQACFSDRLEQVGEAGDVDTEGLIGLLPAQADMRTRRKVIHLVRPCLADDVRE